MEELGFLANAVLAAGKDGGRAFDPRGALEACSALCSLGLELELRAKERASLQAAVAALERVSADHLFRVAAARVFNELTLPARRGLLERCTRYAPEQLAELREALAGDELGAWPDELDAERLRLPPARLDARRGLAEAIPRLAGTLATDSTRFLATVPQLNAGKRLLRGAGKKRKS